MLCIDDPFHGAILNHRHGRQGEGDLTITVRGQAGLDDAVTVNGLPAARAGTQFAVDLPLASRQTDIVAAAEGVRGRREHRVRVIWDRYSKPRYRFSIDDNSFFLRDVAQKGYASLFDCFYLAVLRDLHRRYGTKFVLNVFHQTPERDFDLSHFPERYKGEWRDNAGWLKLAFHAYAEFPARPYQYAPPEKLANDFDLVAEQIVRFAGQEAYSPPTVIHYGMVKPVAWPVLAQRGVKVLSGMARLRDGLWGDILYFLDDTRSEYLSRHDAVMDFASGITFSHIDIVVNETPLEEVCPTLARATNSLGTAEILDIFTHEQYFWPFYSRYLPDHVQRCEAAIRWATEQGYEPVFFHEGLLGGRDWS
jgi:hypothetical protein